MKANDVHGDVVPDDEMLEMLKQTLAHLLINYEFRLSENKKKMTLQYTTMVIPTYGVKIQLRKLA
ncbi:hypothetical protein CJF30_00009823 [Rutstroemia sp. NJR-2017a BBW]|nr:hypothetical protein CJF30_00009823 [Rutstroemia sp. NJR-2017a BBW]